MRPWELNARWRRLDPEVQRSVIRRLKAQPVLLALPLWRRLPWIPVVVWRQMAIGMDEYLSGLYSLRAALYFSAGWAAFFLFGDRALRLFR